MNTVRVRAELPETVAQALDTLTAYDAALGAETWDRVARSVVLRLARELLTGPLGGEGWNRPRRATYLETCMSPALRAVVPTLPTRQWGASTVAQALCPYFELYSAVDVIRSGI